ncbi:MAG: hypothetical protein HQL43_16635 [Alphaproteobacteria bacterium]|nr:hypothetical protein [Alphaproteobacteria bacterium]
MADQNKEAAMSIIKDIIVSASEAAKVARSLEAETRQPPPLVVALDNPQSAAPVQARPAPPPPVAVAKPPAPAAPPPPPKPAAPPPAPAPVKAVPEAVKEEIPEPPKEVVKSASQSDVLAMIGRSTPKKPK